MLHALKMSPSTVTIILEQVLRLKYCRLLVLNTTNDILRTHEAMGLALKLFVMYLPLSGTPGTVMVHFSHILH